MSQNPYDQFSKQFFEEFLKPLGEVETSREVPGESRFIDVWFSPNPNNRDSLDLGLLNRIASLPCVLEPYRNPPTVEDVRSCLSKTLWAIAEYQRQGRREKQPVSESNLPQLWILAPRVSSPVLTGIPATPAESWLPGIYQSASTLRTYVVVINELPETPETLWIRLLGKGQTQRRAIEEVSALPNSDERRARAIRLLASWKITMSLGLELDGVDREVLMGLSPAFLEWEERVKQEGRQLGQQEGRQLGDRQGFERAARLSLESILKMRFQTIDPELVPVINHFLALTADEYALQFPLLTSLSREELIARYAS